MPDRTAAILGGDVEAATAACWTGPGCWSGALHRPGHPLQHLPLLCDRLQAQLHIPIIHMIRETVAAIQAMGKKTVGILATDGTVQTGIYQKELTAAGLTPVTLPERLQRR